MSFTLLPKTFRYDFISKQRYAYALSCILFIVSLGAIFFRGGIPLGVDFRGGSFVQFTLSHPIAAQDIRRAFDGSTLKDVVIQAIGSDEKEYSLRFSAEEGASVSDIVYEVLRKDFPQTEVSIVLSETVGAKVSTDMRDKAMEALYYALLIITIYISGRFEDKWGTPLFIISILGGIVFVLSKFEVPIIYLIPLISCITILLFIRYKLSFALGAIFSLLHDILLTAGLLIVCNVSFDLSIVAALLAILGYSLNDTIIVYDRIREQIKKHTNIEHDDLREIINVSISSTLGRTLLTSITTLLVLFSLLFLGGSLLFPFALAITIGVCVGTLSSVFIASPIVLFFGIQKEQNDIVIDENGVV